MHGASLDVFFPAPLFGEGTIARAHLSRCSDEYQAANGAGQDQDPPFTLLPRTPRSVAHHHHGYHTKTEPYVLQFPGEEEDLNTCILLLLSKHRIPNSAGNQSSLCQKVLPPADKAFKFVVSNGI